MDFWILKDEQVVFHEPRTKGFTRGTEYDLRQLIFNNTDKKFPSDSYNQMMLVMSGKNKIDTTLEDIKTAYSVIGHYFYKNEIGIFIHNLYEKWLKEKEVFGYDIKYAISVLSLSYHWIDK